MEGARVKPSTIIYTCIIQACASAGQVNRAMQVFEEMSKRGIQADGATFSVLVASHVQYSAWRAALDVVQQAMASKVKLHSKTYKLLGSGLARAQQHLLHRELEDIQRQWPAEDHVRVNFHHRS